MTPCSDDDEQAPALDLHGMPPERALDRLAQFLHSARVRGERQVSVVTGRGMNNTSGKAILRERVEDWLRSDPALDRGVDSFERRDKGGSIMISLRRAGQAPRVRRARGKPAPPRRLDPRDF